MDRKYFRFHLACVVVWLMYLVMGMIVTYPSPAFPDINSGHYGFKLSLNMSSLLASFTGIFAIPGALLAAFLMDRFGRKFAFVAIIVPNVFGWIIIVGSHSVAALALGRTLTGLALGMTGVTASVYLSELSPKQIRGRMSALGMASINVGAFLVNFLGAFINWRWIGVVSLSILFVASVTVFFMYETPRWLISKGHKQAAALVIEKMWKEEDPIKISKQVEEIEEDIRVLNSTNIWKALVAIVKPPLWKPLLITQLMSLFQTFAGCPYINNYAVTIFRNAMNGAQSSNTFYHNANYESCVIYVGDIVSNLVSSLLIDRFGRRILLLISDVLVLLSLVAAGTYYFVLTRQPAFAVGYLFWLPLTSVQIFHFCYNLCMGSVVSLLVTEMFPTDVRGVASALLNISHNFYFTLIVKVLPTLGIPNYGIFWLFASFTLVGLVFIFFYLPETKGKSLEEIQKLWYEPRVICDATV